MKRTTTALCAAASWVLLAPLTGSAQGSLVFIEADVRADHEDYFTIHRSGDWRYESVNGRRAGIGSLVHTEGRAFRDLVVSNTFPDPRWLGLSLENWEAEVVSGDAPRCPAVGRGSNPNTTVSVIEHTEDYVTVALFDYGDCGSGGHRSFRLRLSYTLADGYNLNAYLEARIRTDHEDYLTVASNGDWQYTSVGGTGAGLLGGLYRAGVEYEHMTNLAAFPAPDSLNGLLRNWRADVIEGTAPRCPATGGGSNPNSTVSVIAHTTDEVVVALFDFGDCNPVGRVDYLLRLSYVTAPALPRIASSPASLVVRQGATARLTAVTQGETDRFEWRKNGRPIGTGGNADRYRVTSPNASSSVLEIAGVLPGDAGAYDVVASNFEGRDVSDAAVLEVLPDRPVLQFRNLGDDLLLEWEGVAGASYQVLTSIDLEQWDPLGEPIVGKPGRQQVLVPIEEDRAFYQLGAEY